MKTAHGQARRVWLRTTLRCGICCRRRRTGSAVAWSSLRQRWNIFLTHEWCVLWAFYSVSARSGVGSLVQRKTANVNTCLSDLAAPLLNVASVGSWEILITADSCFVWVDEWKGVLASQTSTLVAWFSVLSMWLLTLLLEKPLLTGFDTVCIAHWVQHLCASMKHFCNCVSKKKNRFGCSIVLPNACLFLPSTVGFGCLKGSKRLLFMRKSSDRLSTAKYCCSLTLPLTHSASSFTSQLRHAGLRQSSKNNRHLSLCNIFLHREAVPSSGWGPTAGLTLFVMARSPSHSYTPLVPVAFLGAVDVSDALSGLMQCL